MKRFLAPPVLLPSVVLSAMGCAGDRSAPAAESLQPSATEIAVCDTCGACVEAVPISSAHHVSGPVSYPDPPPAGGDHDACWAIWGIHADAVPAERWVHNLEHGGVVFLYDCPGGCGDGAEALSEITGLVGSHPLALITPYTGMSQKFAMVSWGRRLVSDCIDPQAAAAFYTVHVNRGPEQIPDNPAPSCD
jgi:hypothetical protein